MQLICYALKFCFDAQNMCS